jgi:AcrR family transcriptional regulator
MNKQPEITAQTRQNLIDAFWSLYSEKRIDKITVKEITVKAGYNRGTFYEYFVDVYDVLDQIENALIPKQINELPPASIDLDGIGLPMDLFLKLYEENGKYYSVLLGEKGDPAFASRLKEAVKPILLSELTKQSRLLEIELDYVLEFILSSMIGILSYWINKGKSLPPEKLLGLIYDLMNQGVMKRFSMNDKP